MRNTRKPDRQDHDSPEHEVGEVAPRDVGVDEDGDVLYDIVGRDGHDLLARLTTAAGTATGLEKRCRWLDEGNAPL